MRKGKCRLKETLISLTDDWWTVLYGETQCRSKSSTLKNPGKAEGSSNTYNDKGIHADKTVRNLERLWSQTKLRGEKTTKPQGNSEFQRGVSRAGWWLARVLHGQSHFHKTAMDSHQHIHFARGSKIHRGSLNIDPQMHIHSGKWKVQVKGKSFQRKKNSWGWNSTSRSFSQRTTSVWNNGWQANESCWDLHVWQTFS